MKTLISEKYVSKKQDIKEYFKKNSSKLSATTDLFKTTNHLNIMAVTVTWLDEEFTMRNIILGFRPLEDEHSGTDICRLFMEILKEFEIEQKVTPYIFKYYFELQLFLSSVFFCVDPVCHNR